MTKPNIFIIDDNTHEVLFVGKTRDWISNKMGNMPCREGDEIYITDYEDGYKRTEETEEEP